MLENTLENKTKFFAQHWRQNVMMFDVSHPYWMAGGRKEYMLSAVCENTIYSQTSYLELTPLEQISDEDAIEVAKIENSWDTEDYLLRGKNIVKWMFGEDTYYVDKTVKRIYIVDFLRSKGYAVPYMGLSVEDLIKYGWIKLK